MLISNAESITYRDHQNLTARDHSCSKILQKKYDLEQQRAKRFQLLHERTLEKLSHIEEKKSMNQAAIEYKKIMRQLNFQTHTELRIDLQRKRLISFKKLFQLKNDRLRKNLKTLHQIRLKSDQEKQKTSWDKRLAERIAKQKKVGKLLDQLSETKKVFVSNHKKKYQEKWTKLQQSIKMRSLQSRKQVGSEIGDGLKHVPPKKLLAKPFVIGDFQASFDQLLDSEVCEALSTALDLEDKIKVPFAPDDPIYKAAQYIMQVILKNFKKDLSADATTHKNIYERMDKFFDSTKKFVIFVSFQSNYANINLTLLRFREPLKL